MAFHQSAPPLKKKPQVPHHQHQKPQAVPPLRHAQTMQLQVAATFSAQMLIIKGSIKFSNDLVVDGKIEGSISSDGALTVGENARIKAEIKTHSVIIYGKVHGNIEVTDIVELKANAELVGDIKAASLSIEPGAIFVGKSTVGSPSVTPQAAAPVSSAPSPSSAKESSNKSASASNSTSELPLSSKPSSGSKAVSS